MNFDAEGQGLGEVCPQCNSTKTVTYVYNEGFSELECEACGFNSEQLELSDLIRFQGTLLEQQTQNAPPIPLKKMRA